MITNADKQISVIIPVYNCAEFLNRAVQSVLEQDYKKTDIILVDDGSTDGSAELCDELAENNSGIVVIHQKNSGASSARNTGMNEVFSRNVEEESYITFLDADDAWKTAFFNETVSELMKKEYDLIGFQACLCNHDLNRRAESVPLKEGIYKGGRASLWIHGAQCFGAMLYKCSFLKQYGIHFKKLKCSEDKIFSMTCLYLADSIYLGNRLMYLYRQNAVSVMHNRLWGIPYYSSIMEAYLNWDEEMAVWETSERGQLEEGSLLAKIYLKDMMDEHFQMGGNKKQFKEYVQNDPNCQKILSLMSQKERSMTEELQYSLRYRLKNRAKGLVRKACLKLKGNKAIQVWLDRQRYPIEL